MVLEKMWLFSIGNEAEIRPLEMGRKFPRDKIVVCCYNEKTAAHNNFN